MLSPKNTRRLVTVAIIASGMTRSHMMDWYSKCPPIDTDFASYGEFAIDVRSDIDRGHSQFLIIQILYLKATLCYTPHCIINTSVISRARPRHSVAGTQFGHVVRLQYVYIAFPEGSLLVPVST